MPLSEVIEAALAHILAVSAQPSFVTRRVTAVTHIAAIGWFRSSFSPAQRANRCAPAPKTINEYGPRPAGRAAIFWEAVNRGQE